MQIDKWHFCGCVIISAKWALSSAHCVRMYDIWKVEIFYSTYNLDNEIYGRRIGIDVIKIAEEYDSKNYINDTSLIKVKKEFSLTGSQFTQISKDYVRADMELKFVGWGWTVSYLF